MSENNNAQGPDQPTTEHEADSHVVSTFVFRTFATDHPSAAGHFPGNPIIPGAVLLREIVAAISDDTAICREVRAAKFHRPVRPGDTVIVCWSVSKSGEVRFSCSLERSLLPAVTGMLRVAPT